jgi:chaperonin cofactor prefoldin
MCYTFYLTSLFPVLRRRIMPTSIEVFLFIFGAFMILVALFRGNIELSGLKIPQISSVTSVIAAFIGIITITAALFISLGPGKSLQLGSSQPPQNQDQEQEMQDIENRLSTLSGDVANLKNDIKLISQKPDQSVMVIRLNQIETSITEVQTKTANLERVILDDPLKALEVPLLRKDIDNTKDLYSARLSSIEQSIGQLYGLIIGVLVVIGVGFLGIAATNFAASRKSDTPDKLDQTKSQSGKP